MPCSHAIHTTPLFTPCLVNMRRLVHELQRSVSLLVVLSIAFGSLIQSVETTLLALHMFYRSLMEGSWEQPIAQQPLNPQQGADNQWYQDSW